MKRVQYLLLRLGLWLLIDKAQKCLEIMILIPVLKTTITQFLTVLKIVHIFDNKRFQLILLQQIHMNFEQFKINTKLGLVLLDLQAFQKVNKSQQLMIFWLLGVIYCLLYCQRREETIWSI